MTRKQRSALVQWGLFVAGIAVVAITLGVTVRWGALANRFFKWDDFTDQFPDIIIEAARNTLVYTAIGYGGGLVIGLIVALMRQSSVPPARILGSVYVEIFRALPALLTILIVGFGLPIAFGAENLPGFLSQPWGAGCLALALVAGAYLAETIRAGIEAVPRGQVEAARSLAITVERLASQRPGRAAYLAQIHPLSGLPDEPVRQAFIELGQKVSHTLNCIGIVFEGQGFGAAALRAFVTGLGMSAGIRFPMRGFSTLPAMVEWVRPRLIAAQSDPGSEREIQAAFDHLRAQLAPP